MSCREKTALGKVPKAWLYGLTATCLALSGMAEVAARTLLIVRPEADLVEFVDPGSGLRLAVVKVGSGPRRISVSPEGKRAAIVNCGNPTPTLSIVDLENPRELQRTALALTACPSAWTWFAADRIAVALQDPDDVIAIETDSGRSLGPVSPEDRKALEGSGQPAGPIDPGSAAVQHFIAAGGNLDQLAVTPVLPRATCHACAAEP